MKSPIEHGDDGASGHQSVDTQKSTDDIIMDITEQERVDREKYGDHKPIPEGEKNAFRLALEKAGVVTIIEKKSGQDARHDDARSGQAGWTQVDRDLEDAVRKLRNLSRNNKGDSEEAKELEKEIERLKDEKFPGVSIEKTAKKPARREGKREKPKQQKAPRKQKGMETPAPSEIVVYPTEEALLEKKLPASFEKESIMTPYDMALERQWQDYQRQREEMGLPVTASFELEKESMMTPYDAALERQWQEYKKQRKEAGTQITLRKEEDVQKGDALLLSVVQDETTKLLGGSESVFIPETIEDAEVIHVSREVLARMTPEEKKQAGVTMSNVGFQVDALVNAGMSRTARTIAKGFDERSVLGRFFSAYAKNYEDKNENLSERIKQIDAGVKGRSGRVINHLTNLGYLSGNILRFSRITAGTFITPLFGAAFAGTMADAMKEARFENVKVKEGTRIADADEAFDQAMEIMRRARQKSPNGTVTAEILKKAYREELPKDLLRRLAENKELGVRTNIVQKAFTWMIKSDAQKMQKALNEIESDYTLSFDEQEMRKEELLARFGRSKRLQDYDRMLNQQGLVDTLAASGVIGGALGKAAMTGFLAESTVLLFEGIADAVASNQPATVVHHPSHTPTETTPEPPKATPAPIVFDVEKGDTLWGAIGTTLEERGVFDGMEEGQRTYVIDALKDRFATMTPDELKAIGFSSGNIDVIHPGDRIDLTSVLGDTAGVNEAVDDALELSQDQISSIEDYTPVTIDTTTGEHIITPNTPEYTAKMEVYANIKASDDVNEIFGTRGFLGFFAQDGTRSISWIDKDVGFAHQPVEKVLEDRPSVFPTSSDRTFGIENDTDTRKMREYLLKIILDSGVTPRRGELVADFMKRAAEEVFKNTNK